MFTIQHITPKNNGFEYLIASINEEIRGWHRAETRKEMTTWLQDVVSTLNQRNKNVKGSRAGVVS